MEGQHMLLEHKTAIIYGAGGAIGGAVARAFAREGAKVFLSGRTLSKVEQVAEEIRTAGGAAEAFLVDAMDEGAVESHVAAVVKATGRLDISFNAITAVPQPGTQGIPLAQLSADAFIAPINLYMRSHFLTARAAGRRMAEQGSGVLLMNTPEPARIGAALVGGMGPAWAGMEALNRNLSAEFGARGVRALCIRSTGIPETTTIDVVFGLHADTMGITKDQFQGFIESLTHRKRSSTLSEVAEIAAFLASDRCSGMTGTIANLTGGLIVD
jgi:NAD(P)-dependent dehydrogenase (short-subunit alcohol dehydrogenase family)